MIQEKDLQELRPQAKYENGKNITLHTIQAAASKAAQERDIPVAFYTDQVKSGGFGGSVENCLILYHPDHPKDYFSISVRIKYQEDYAFISMDTLGVSKLMKAEAIRKQINATAKEGINYRGYNLIERAAGGAAIVGAGIVGVRHLVKGKSDKEKLEVEQEWYSIVCNLLNEIFADDFCQT